MSDNIYYETPGHPMGSDIIFLDIYNRENLTEEEIEDYKKQYEIPGKQFVSIVKYGENNFTARTSTRPTR